MKAPSLAAWASALLLTALTSRAWSEEAAASRVEPGNEERDPLVVATDPNEPTPAVARRYHHLPRGTASVRVGAGRSFTQDVADGYHLRLDMEARFRQVDGPMIGGVYYGGEYWFAEGAGGGSVPAGGYVGAGVAGMSFALGGGFDLLVVDEVHDDTGFGLYAPFATGALGVDAGVVRLEGDVRAKYRWQWGARDRWQIQAGVTLAAVIFGSP